MPTSNGQISVYDIRRGAVVETAIRDDAVATAKIQDLAVNDDKNEDARWSYAVESPPFVNPTLTTTSTLQTSVSVDIPTWVNQLSVFAVANAQMDNSSGGDQSLNIQARINGEFSGGRSMTVVNGDTGSIDHVTVFDVVGVAGSTVTVEAWAYVGSGTNSSNSGTCWAILVGNR